MTREEFDNLLVELSGAHVKWDTRFKLLAAYDDLTTQRDNFRARCADLESRLDIGTGNMYDVVVLENEMLRARVAELVEQCNTINDELRGLHPARMGGAQAEG